MTVIKIAIVVSLFVAVLACVSGGSAQQDTVGDLGLLARQQDNDSYWLDTRAWAFYGYRPYAKVHTTRFDPALPSYVSGQHSYSYGMNMPANTASWEGGPSNNQVQLTKYGTWH